MSHFAFFAEPTPVETRHGPTFVGVGESADGTPSIAVVGPGDDSTDLHLSHRQALALMAELANGICTLVALEARRDVHA